MLTFYSKNYSKHVIQKIMKIEDIRESDNNIT